MGILGHPTFGQQIRRPPSLTGGGPECPLIVFGGPYIIDELDHVRSSISFRELILHKTESFCHMSMTRLLDDLIILITQGNVAIAC